MNSSTTTAIQIPKPKTNTRLAAYVGQLEASLPTPERALRLARLLIPLSMITGLVVQPLLYWLIPILSV